MATIISPLAGGNPNIYVRLVTDYCIPGYTSDAQYG